MEREDMTFDEIIKDQQKFLSQYEVSDKFNQSKVSWETLMEIGNDYEQKCYGSGREHQVYKGEYYELIQSHIAKIASFKNVHTYRFRIKKTGSLLAKIIRKSIEHGEEYTVDNYMNKITDLMGIRILYIFKEDYWPVHEQIMSEYENVLAQDINLKLKKGDDKNIYEKLLRRHSNVRIDENETYRSIHYTIYAKKNERNCIPRIEIQTRTIFEEGWSEINHKLVYKQNVNNDGLNKTSDVLSSMVGACDSIGMLMKMLHDNIALDNDSSENTETVSTDEEKVVYVIKNFLKTI